MGKPRQKWAKDQVSLIYWEIWFYFFQDLVYDESLYYLMYSSTNPIFGKNLVSEIQTKILLANQIAGALNQLYGNL